MTVWACTSKRARPHRDDHWIAVRGLIGGVVITEMIFALPGFGRMIVEGIANADDFGEVLKRFDVVLLPDVTCMSDREAAALDTYVAGGGAIVAAAETGIRTEYGDARQTNVLKSLPIARLREVRPDMFASYLRIGESELDFPLTRLIMLNGVYVDVEPKPRSETFLKVQPPQRFGPPEFS